MVLFLVVLQNFDKDDITDLDAVQHFLQVIFIRTVGGNRQNFRRPNQGIGRDGALG